jgi:hypothetical protein
MVNWQTLHIWLSWTSKLVDPSMTSCSTLCSRWSWLSINVTCWIWLTFLCIGEISKVCHGTPPHLRYFSRWFKRKPHLLMVEHYLHCRATTFQICFPDSWGSKLASFWKVATTYINQDIFLCRDLSKPIAVQNPKRVPKYQETYRVGETFLYLCCNNQLTFGKFWAS